jgi:UDP-glucose 4-epimerase
MHVLVTGGAGFIGSHVTELLLERGHRVRVIDDLSSGRREHVPAEAEFIWDSVTEAETCRHAVAGVDAVVHLAAIASVARSVEAPSATHPVNLGATIRLAEAAAAAGVVRFVYASTAAVYGTVEREAHRETDPVAPITPYAIDKLAGESYLRFFADEHGLDARALRFFNVYGPRQLASSPYSGVIARFATALLEDEPVTVFGDGEQTRDFIYVGDVARIVAHHVEELDAPAQMRVMNVCNGTSTSLNELIGVLAPAAGRRAEIRYGPPRNGDIRHSRGDDGELRRWLPDRQRTSLGAGLGAVIDWMRSSRSDDRPLAVTPAS